MRILIISDTHRRNENYLEAVKSCEPLDMVIHCGDVEGSEYIIENAVACPVAMVAGNNDFFSELPRERDFKLGNYRIWLTHGHNYYVSMENTTIIKEATLKGADIVMYGHTHRPIVEYHDDVIAINPGSLTYPRQEGKRPSFILMEIDRMGEAHFTINYL